MGSKKFDIKTFESFSSPVVEFKKRVYDENGNMLIISPGKEISTERSENSFSIDIHEFENEEGKKEPIRSITKNISIELIPDWNDKVKFESKLPNVLNMGENPDEILVVAIRLICPKINFVIESKKVSIKDITDNKPIKFKPFNLNDVIGKVDVESELVRIKSTNSQSATIAFSSLTILAKNKSISFYIDEVDEIGVNALPLIPADTKDKMFVIKNLKEFGIEPPVLLYHKQFKDYFNNGDDYLAVQTLMILIGIPYCDSLLKWIIFGNPDYEKKEHKVILKFIGDLCDKREQEISKISNLDDIEKNKIYLELSQVIFENAQNMGVGWKKLLYQIVTSEKK